MARKKKVICIVDGCDDEVVALGMCSACYNRTRYWNHRSVKDKMAHLKRMERSRSSMQMMMGNVRPIQTAKRKRRAS